jgi:hypothetical protein
MFQWYKKSQVCYAYLDDVPAEEADHEREGSAFQNSKWFTRGWTLQELLAPQTVVFFNHEWVEIGTRCTFNQLITSMTGITSNFLEERFENASTAQKFSWASKRETLRIEDTAYCLMGLFGVNMPLLYGEGSQAFIRLQLEIMKSSDDDSIFAWADNSMFSSHPRITGLLANSPAAFSQSGNVITPFGRFKSATPYAMTNRGLNISLMLIPAAEAAKKGVQFFKHETYPILPESLQFFAPLSCYTKSEPPLPHNTDLPAERINILLRLGRITESDGHTWYVRLRSDRLHKLPKSAIPSNRKKEQIFVPQFDDPKVNPVSAISKFAIDAKYFFSNGFTMSSIMYPTDEVSGIRNNRLRTSWYQHEHGDSEGIHVLKLGADRGEFVAFVEFKGGPPVHCEDTFVLQIYRSASRYCRSVGVILHLSNGRSLDEIILKAREAPLSPLRQRDRDTLALPSGHMVSAALRTRARDGELMFAVDFDVKF